MKFAEIWRKKGTKPCFFITVGYIVVALTICLVLMFQPLVHQTLNNMWGDERRVLVSGDPSKYQYYTSEYSTKEDVLSAANQLNEEIVGEGITLFKNENETLPLAKKSKITVLGKNSVNLVMGGSGSNASASAMEGAKDLYDSLSAAEFECNPTTKAFYEDDTKSGAKRPACPNMGDIVTGFPTAETSQDKYTQEVKNSFTSYNDAAIIVISRIGGEGYDLPRTMFWDGSIYKNWKGTQLIPGTESVESHYLELDLNEKALIAQAKNSFDKVIIVLNCATSMELKGIQEDSGVDAIVWMGTAGKTGIMSLGKVLNGDINPSGRTIDTYIADFTKDPTWNNFGNNRMEGGNQYKLNGQTKKAYFVNYEEGIYVGYRYWETRGYTEVQKDSNSTWYEDNVVYPFGYGKSYSDFSWEIVTPNSTVVTATDGTIQVEVKVTNKSTSKQAGKEVVELYYSTPYTQGEIEKPYVQLGAFAKTKLLAPSESEIVTLNLKVRDMASFDYNDANHNDFKGYELEQGEYKLFISKDAHSPISSLTYTQSNTEKFNKDEETNNDIKPLFADADDKISKFLSRADWEGTWPSEISDEKRAITQTDVDNINYHYKDDETQPWYTEEMPTQSDHILTEKEVQIKFYEMIGVKYTDRKWDEFLNQLTVDQMKTFVAQGSYQTGAIENVGKPKTNDADGPMGFSIFLGNPSVYGTCNYTCEAVMAATWNVKLAKDYGVMIGNESCVGNVKGDGRTYAGWYAPAVNIHRSQFSGRNFEYYSEDGMISGAMAASVIQGARSKGVYTYVKHFALNDQETNRDTTGLLTWANEQSMRELYFVPFEMSVKEGKAVGVMSSFNRIGYTWAGGNYNLLTNLLRKEWGFVGAVITDYNLTPYMDVDQMIRAGGDLNLSQTKKLNNQYTATDVSCVRQATKNVLYNQVNSNAMNGLGEGVVYGYAMPTWCINMWLIAGGIFILILAMDGILIYKNFVKKQQKK